MDKLGKIIFNLSGYLYDKNVRLSHNKKLKKKPINHHRGRAYIKNRLKKFEESYGYKISMRDLYSKKLL